ncbi:MAG: LytTR family DNA-binding domain-containing protein [Bacteroidota bacterium]
MWIILNYNILKKWKVVVSTTLVMIIIYLAIIYLHPENLGWINSPEFSVSNLLWFVIVDQFLIECVTVTILFWLIRMYAFKLKLTELRLTLRELILYQIRFLPVFFLAFFVFAPFSLTLRFLLHHIPDIDSDIYFSQYFYSVETYLNYLPPVLLIGYTVLNVNLLRLYNEQLGQVKHDLSQIRKPKLKDRLFVFDESGELLLEVDKIMWFQRENRKTFAVTQSDKYRLKETVSELEETLDPGKFIRINRSTIVNLNFMLNYSFWENDKYVVRIKDSAKEFIMSRERLNKVKCRFKEQNH